MVKEKRDYHVSKVQSKGISPNMVNTLAVVYLVNVESGSTD